jgi:beta-lactamase class A
MKIRQRSMIIVLSTTVVVLLISVIWLMVQNQRLTADNFEAQKQGHSYLNPTQGFYDDADLLVNMRPLREELQGLANGKKVSIYFEFLNTGANIRVDDVPFWPGSLMKIPVAMAAMKKIESGAWSMNDQLVLTDADKNPAYGDLYKLPSGATFTIEELLKELLVQSDDTARAIFVRNLGEQSVENVLDYLGLQDVFNNNLQVTAQRYSNFWRALYNASYLTPEDSQTLLGIMDLPHDQKLLRQGMPDSVSFSHKIGVYGDVYSDSGIIYVPNRPYILTVMVQSSSTDEVREVMKDISRDAFEYVTK